MSVETSIVIRTLNEEKHLEKLMKGIHDQNYRDWEIIVVDSGSTDNTLDIAKQYGARIYHIPQSEFTFGRSLNRGCEQATGCYLVFASGHVWPVTNNWLRNMVKPFQEDSIAMVYGKQRGTEASRLLELRDLEDHFGSNSYILMDEPNGNNGNAAIRRDLWMEKQFDESLPGLEDIDWARWAEKQGRRVCYAANASVYHSHEESLRQVYRRYYREAVATKRMFPHNSFSWFDLVKVLPYFVLRDISYALRHSKPEKLCNIPGERMAQLLGLLQGYRYQYRLEKEVKKNLNIPSSYSEISIHSPGNHGIKEVQLPVLKRSEVLIQIAYSSVSMLDLQLADENAENGSDNTNEYPIIPGQICSGIVVDTFDTKHGSSLGSKVLREITNKTSLSQTATMGSFDTLRESGSYSEYVVVQESQIFNVPIDISLKQAISVKTLSDLIMMLKPIKAKHESQVCVLGAGSIGNLTAQLLISWGLSVTSVDPDPWRLSLLHKYDINTLIEQDDLSKYQYVVNAEVCEATMMLPEHFSDFVASNVKKLICEDRVDSTSVRKDWDEAIELVRKGIVRLDNHADLVGSFEEYKHVWDKLTTEQNLSAVLRVSNTLDSF